MVLMIVVMFSVLAVGGAFLAFSGDTGASKKRLAAVSGNPSVSAAARGPADNNQRRKNVTALLKDLEKQQAEKKKRVTLRRRIEQAGLTITPRSFWLLSATGALG